MLRFDRSTFSWGSELEWGDVYRKLEIPPELGSWEYSETDILNLREPYALMAGDPLGLEPPMGGEINTRPTMSTGSQVQKVFDLMDFFTEAGCPPTVTCMQGMHIHTHIPGLVEDIEALRRLARYVKANQRFLTSKLHGFGLDRSMKGTTAATYLRNSANTMPDWMCDNLQAAESFEDFIRIQCCGKDGVSRGRPFRYGINMYCLKHIGTLEWRLPRATLNREQISDVFEFVGRVTEAAVNEDGLSAEEIYQQRSWNFAEFDFSNTHYRAWERTKYPKERGTKTRVFIDVS